MPFQASLAVFRHPAIFCSVISLCAACSEAPSPGDKGSGGAGSGAVGGRAGSAGTGGAGTAGSNSGSGSGGTASGTGGTSSGAAGTASGAGGSTSGAGGTSAGAAGATSGAGGAASGAGGAASGAGGKSGGAGGKAGGPGGGAGEGGSSTGGLSGSGGSSGGAGGAGGAPTRSPGCGTTVQRPNPRTQQTMDRDGTTRYYLLDVPSDADNETPLALVFGLHGYDMNNVAVVDLYNFTSRSNGRAITVLPQGEGPPPGDVSHWGDHVLESTWMANEANYSFIQALMLDIQDRFCVDPSRVFITGFSMGGFFTNSLACAHSDWFRAFAPVAGGGPGSCANANAKPAIMLHHGTTDDIVTIDSGEASRDFWVEHNGCASTTTQSYTGCQSYGSCPEASPVTWCVGNWNHTISATASANIWSFFDSF
jgi:polyhydroxybutyrate depolymerase